MVEQAPYTRPGSQVQSLSRPTESARPWPLVVRPKPAAFFGRMRSCQPALSMAGKETLMSSQPYPCRLCQLVHGAEDTHSA